jgi:hypothetical protein
MKKFVAIIRNDLSKKDPTLKELYKDYSEKKRSITHFSTEIEKSTLIISEIKAAFQKCLNSSLMEYKEFIDIILTDSDMIQNEYRGLAQNFNHFLFSKLVEFLRIKFRENKIDVENCLEDISEEFDDKFAYCMFIVADVVKFLRSKC